MYSSLSENPDAPWCLDTFTLNTENVYLGKRMDKIFNANVSNVNVINFNDYCNKRNYRYEYGT